MNAVLYYGPAVLVALLLGGVSAWWAVGCGMRGGIRCGAWRHYPGYGSVTANPYVRAQTQIAGPLALDRSEAIYSACPYNLSAGPLRVTAPVLGTYMSVSCFASNTDNFYAKNDRHVETSFDFVLIGPGTPQPESLGTDVVRSSTTTGGIIFRYFVGDGTHEEQIENIRNEIRVARLDRDE